MTVRLRRVVVGPMATNCWVLHADGDRRALVVDPGDEPERIRAVVADVAADVDVVAVVLTHAHWDHVLAAGTIDAPVLAHPEDGPVWPHELATLDRLGHWDAGTATAELLAAGHGLRPVGPVWDGHVDGHLADGQVLAVGPLDVEVLHTPGHTPGGVSLHVDGHLLTGDTLFPGGPGLTGWPLSDFPTIMTSVRRLAALPAATVVHPGHGPATTIGAERPHVDEWAARGW
jgi:glyoxylase-like metal-dependent hydrolase (beta-lactamase superfamily II)